MDVEFFSHACHRLTTTVIAIQRSIFFSPLSEQNVANILRIGTDGEGNGGIVMVLFVSPTEPPRVSDAVNSDNTVGWPIELQPLRGLLASRHALGESITCCVGV